jgi:hypothetical protein
MSLPKGQWRRLAQPMQPVLSHDTTAPSCGTRQIHRHQEKLLFAADFQVFRFFQIVRLAARISKYPYSGRNMRATGWHDSQVPPRIHPTHGEIEFGRQIKKAAVSLEPHITVFATYFFALT